MTATGYIVYTNLVDARKLCLMRWHVANQSQGVGVVKAIPSWADSGMELSEQRHHVPLVPRRGRSHPLAEILGCLRSQQIPTVQLTTPHPLKEVGVRHPFLTLTPALRHHALHINTVLCQMLHNSKHPSFWLLCIKWLSLSLRVSMPAVDAVNDQLDTGYSCRTSLPKSVCMIWHQLTRIIARCSPEYEHASCYAEVARQKTSNKEDS